MYNGASPQPDKACACGRGVCRRAEVVAHQLSHTPQVDSIFNVPAGKDNLPQGFWIVAGRGPEVADLQCFAQSSVDSRSLWSHVNRRRRSSVFTPAWYADKAA